MVVHPHTNMTHGAPQNLKSCKISFVSPDCHVTNNIHRLLAEELRKIFIALWEESNCSCSPDSLFSVVLKVVPQFR